MTDFQAKKQEILHIYRNKTDQNRDMYEVGYPDKYEDVLAEASKALDQLYEAREQEIRVKAFNNGAKVTRAKILKALLKHKRSFHGSLKTDGLSIEAVPVEAIKELLCKSQA